MIIAGCGHTGKGADMLRDLAGGALHARVVAHTVETPVESIPCWTYVTDGLLAVGQKELTLTVAREAGESSPPSSPFEFFETVWKLAKTGRIVDVGDFTKFSKGGLFGRSDLQGIIYVPAQSWIGITYEAPTLHAIVVTGNELDTAKEYGALRILGELGLAHRAFPTAPWLDRKRAQLRTAEATRTDSVLSKTLTASVPGLLATQVSRGVGMQEAPAPRVPGDTFAVFEAPEIVMSIPTGAAATTRDGLRQLESDKPLTFIAHVDRDAQASFVWTPGKRAPDVIGFAHHDGRRISVNAVVFVPTPGAENTSTFFEDSAAFTLDPGTWASVRDALGTGHPLRVPTTGYFSALRVEWRGDAHAEAPTSPLGPSKP
jgi:hypothetical protein